MIMLWFMWYIIFRILQVVSQVATHSDGVAWLILEAKNWDTICVTSLEPVNWVNWVNWFSLRFVDPRIAVRLWFWSLRLEILQPMHPGCHRSTTSKICVSWQLWSSVVVRTSMRKRKRGRHDCLHRFLLFMSQQTYHKTQDLPSTRSKSMRWKFSPPTPGKAKSSLG